MEDFTVQSFRLLQQLFHLLELFGILLYVHFKDHL